MANDLLSRRPQTVVPRQDAAHDESRLGSSSLLGCIGLHSKQCGDQRDGLRHRFHVIPLALTVLDDEWAVARGRLKRHLSDTGWMGEVPDAIIVCSRELDAQLLDRQVRMQFFQRGDY